MCGLAQESNSVAEGEQKLMTSGVDGRSLVAVPRPLQLEDMPQIKRSRLKKRRALLYSA